MALKAFAAHIHASTAVAPTDDVLLGNLTEPQDIALAALRQMDRRCARAAATQDFPSKVARRLLSKGLAGAWVDAVSECYLEPYGVAREAYPCWSATTACIAPRDSPSKQSHHLRC